MAEPRELEKKVEFTLQSVGYGPSSSTFFPQMTWFYEDKEYSKSERGLLAVIQTVVPQVSEEAQKKSLLGGGWTLDRSIGSKEQLNLITEQESIPLQIPSGTTINNDKTVIIPTEFYVSLVCISADEKTRYETRCPISLANAEVIRDLRPSDNSSSGYPTHPHNPENSSLEAKETIATTWAWKKEHRCDQIKEIVVDPT